MNRLVYQHDGARHEIPLEDKPVTLGRSDDADVKLPARAASRIHAQALPREGAWWIEDLQSSNGTLLNGRKIDSPTRLKAGDTVGIGGLNLTFEGPAAAAPPDAKVARLLYTPDKDKPPIEILLHTRVTIGRKPDNTLHIDSKAVSGHHAEVVRRDGQYVLIDLGSSNGTFVDKRQVKQHVLRNGDSLLLGKLIPLYFVDPAAVDPAAVDPAAPGAPVVPAPPPDSAPTGSERGMFEPVAPLPPPRPRRSLTGPVLVGLVLGGLLAFAGWAVGEVVYGFRLPQPDRQTRRVPDPALPDTAFSFEGEIDNNGNPEGWTAAFEATGGATAELLSDPDKPWDGRRSLALRARNLRGNATLVLTTSKARPVELGGSCTVLLHARAEGTQRISVALALQSDTGRSHTLAAGTFVGLQGGEWVQLELKGLVTTQLPESGRYQLMLCGAFSGLWIDRLEIVGDSEAPKPAMRGATAGELAVSLDPIEPARATVSNNRHSALMTPRLLAHDNEVVSEPDLWAVTEAAPTSAAYSALLPRRGETARVEVTSRTCEPGYFEGSGLDLQWKLQDGNAADSLALEIELPLPAGATVVAADRRGAPVEINLDVLHTWAYSTISELMVNETGLALNFPDGAVLWIDQSRSDRLVVVVRGATSSGRAGVRVQVFTRPLMFARMYERLYDEAARMWDAEHGSAAKARLEYLQRPIPHSELAVVTRAKEKLAELEEARKALREEVEAAWAAVQAMLTDETLLAAERLVRRYVATWQGEDDAAEMHERLRQAEVWQAELDARKRTPEELKQAEAIARRLWKDAETSHDAGDLLLALVLAETIVKSFADTSVHRNALVMQEQIAARLNDPEVRDNAIDAELAGIDEDIKFRDYARAKQRCIALFRRFPDTPRNRDIMQRLRQVEDAFQD